MKLVRNGSTHVVLYMFNDSDIVVLTKNGLVSPTVVTDISSDTHDVVTGSAPTFFVGGAMSYDVNNGVWTMVNQDVYNSGLVGFQPAIIGEAVAHVQRMLDAEAQKHGYDDLRSTISYFNSSVPLWSSEAKNAVAWRDACWLKAHQLQNDVMAGNIPLPTVDEVIAQMPPPNWPTA